MSNDIISRFSREFNPQLFHQEFYIQSPSNEYILSNVEENHAGIACHTPVRASLCILQDVSNNGPTVRQEPIFSNSIL